MGSLLEKPPLLARTASGPNRPFTLHPRCRGRGQLCGHSLQAQNLHQAELTDRGQTCRRLGLVYWRLTLITLPDWLARPCAAWKLIAHVCYGIYHGTD
jgi:hypothetical protein